MGEGISENLISLLEQAIGIDIDHLKNKRTIQTWILTRRIDSNQLSVHVVTDSDHDVMETARNIIRQQKNEITAYIIGMHGKVQVEGKGYVNGLFYEVEESSLGSAFNYMIGYSINITGIIEIDDNYGFYRQRLPLLS